MSSVTIRPATTADAPAIAQVHYNALDRFHEFYAAFFARHPRESIRMATASALATPVNVFLVAQEAASGAVVGFVRYNMVNHAAEEEQKLNIADPPSSSPWAVKEHMKGLWGKVNERGDEMDACYEEAAKGERHAHVKHLMVDPSHQRRGVGTALLERVTARMDGEGVPAFMVSSAESHNLYARLGFDDLGTWTIDNGGLAAEVTALERQLGIEGNEGLSERYRGVKEVEAYMFEPASSRALEYGMMAVKDSKCCDADGPDALKRPIEVWVTWLEHAESAWGVWRRKRVSR